jgi:glucuronate isomerase
MAIKKNKTIITEDFLLSNKHAVKLFHDYASKLPIIDYHNHLSPKDLAENKNFANLTEIWLKGDHYKWRAMRALGVNEKFITGAASDADKFNAWAQVFPQTVRNPLFHWSQMELKNSFGVDEYLNEKSAKGIYKTASALLQKNSHSAQSLLNNYKVELVGTTDDPCDDLSDHRKIKESEFKTQVLPTFRPDKIFNIGDRASFLQYIGQLEKAAGIKIYNISDLLAALEKRINYFHKHGCRISDHGLISMPAQVSFTSALEKEFAQFVQGKNKNNFSSPDRFVGSILFSLCKMYHKRGWVQQFHLGPIRNNNTRIMGLVGVDAGTDSIGDYPQAVNLSQFLNALDQRDQLAKTILYNINPADNEVFAAMCGNFNDGSLKGKVQFGSGWWFLDQKQGMENQLNALSNLGLISTFIGMTTDSRSFLSYSRHEYFRRVLCNLLGTDMENGIIPNDEKWIGEIIKNISYYNAKAYFNL